MTYFEQISYRPPEYYDAGTMIDDPISAKMSDVIHQLQNNETDEKYYIGEFSVKHPECARILVERTWFLFDLRNSILDIVSNPYYI